MNHEHHRPSAVILGAVMCAALSAAILTADAAAAAPAGAPDPRRAANLSRITVSGEVLSVSRDSFRLGYGSQPITVELDDWDRMAETRALQKGYKVTVRGRIDDDVFQRRRIEASSVYVADLNTYYYASAADEEDIDTPHVREFEPFVGLTGFVESIDGREFVLDTGVRDVRVDTAGLPDNPLDDRGFYRIEVGDRVRVTGEPDDALFEKREVDATAVLTLAEG